MVLHARDVARARERPRFVDYTIGREERSGDAIVAAGTYTERVWYRERDGAALARRIEGGVASGPLLAERPTLDGDVDPGPPTADIFEAGGPPALATPAPSTETGLKVLAAVSVRGEFDYRAFADGDEAGAVRLRLEPRRDPERNRLRELWIDARNGNVLRLRMRDRIYFATRASDVPGTFECREGLANGVWSLVSVASVADVSGAASGAAMPSVRYRFEDVAFPASLPDWYFDAYTYAKHARDAPNR
ncbi:MAG: hypothetical protein IAI50_06855 [Candidatus Eremiobacteraeota bacterium]|nr:hypothetical protein [Candidatus Eremiobacteraeota bacterium]